jgi:hypothetical protein
MEEARTSIYETLVCRKCERTLHLEHFKKNKEHPLGVENICRKCANEVKRLWSRRTWEIRCKQRNEFRRTMEGYAGRMFDNLLQRVKKEPSYQGREVRFARKELIKWVLDQPWYVALYEDWKRSGFERGLAPTLDRIDNEGHYELGNILLMTQSDNSRKGSGSVSEFVYIVIKERDAAREENATLRARVEELLKKLSRFEPEIGCDICGEEIAGPDLEGEFLCDECRGRK